MRRAIASAFLLLAAAALDERPPVIIVTGLPHGGTTDAGAKSFEQRWTRFTWALGLAQRHPLVHAVSFEDLFVHRKGRTRKALFEFLGLKGFSPDFSGKALAAKRGRCHLCDHSVAKRRRNETNT